MRVVITGGTGLIGQALVHSLVTDTHEVIVLSRSPERAGGLPGAAQAVQWDAQTTKGWGHWLDGAHAVVNLAGEGIAEGRWTVERKQRIRESRIRAGQAVVSAIAAVATKPRVLIQSSAVGYYGPRRDEMVQEDTSPGTDFLARVCFDWEASTAAAEKHGVRRAVIRTGVVLSLGGGAFPRLLLPFQLFAGGPIGNGKQYFPWIHLDDEVRAIRFLIDHNDTQGPYNLAAPNPLTNGQFATLIGRVMGRPAVIPAPAFAMKLIFGEMSTVLLDGQRAIPGRLQEAGFEFRFPEAEAALRALLGK